MPKAYVLINTVPEVEEEFLEELRKIDGVKEADSVYGIYDFIAKVEAESLEKVKEIITWKIRRLKEVRSSVTLIAVED
ncbi:MAG: Lrp/AsnC ligand binding domain-containing protein [Nitrososphaerota archaeon]